VCIPEFMVVIARLESGRIKSDLSIHDAPAFMRIRCWQRQLQGLVIDLQRLPGCFFQLKRAGSMSFCDEDVRSASLEKARTSWLAISSGLCGSNTALPCPKLPVADCGRTYHRRSTGHGFEDVKPNPHRPRTGVHASPEVKRAEGASFTKP